MRVGSVVEIMVELLATVFFSLLRTATSAGDFGARVDFGLGTGEAQASVWVGTRSFKDSMLRRALLWMTMSASVSSMAEEDVESAFR